MYTAISKQAMLTHSSIHTFFTTLMELLLTSSIRLGILGEMMQVTTALSMILIHFGQLTPVGLLKLDLSTILMMEPSLLVILISSKGTQTLQSRHMLITKLNNQSNTQMMLTL
jgi:hypothetical protein